MILQFLDLTVVLFGVTVEFIFVVLEVVGFMKDCPWGLGGLLELPLELLTEETLFKGTLLTVLGGTLTDVLLEVITILGFVTLVALLLKGFLLTVLVDAELFKELLELTMLFREFERWTLVGFFDVMLFWESTFFKLTERTGVTGFLAS